MHEKCNFKSLKKTMVRLNVKGRMTMKYIYRKGIVRDGVEWIHVGLNRDQWLTVVNVVLKLLSPFLDQSVTLRSQSLGMGDLRVRRQAP